MRAYIVEIRQESLGSAAPRVETVCALAENEAAVLALVRTAMRLEDEAIKVIRTLADHEAQQLGLKPFQVKRIG